MAINSGELFQQAFTLSANVERKRHREFSAADERKRNQVTAVQHDVEEIISRIPTLFEVRELNFDTAITFEVTLPLRSNLDEAQQRHWHVGVYPYGAEHKDTYVVSLKYFPAHDDVKEIRGYCTCSNEVIQFVANELGNILGQEHELFQHSI